MKLIHSTIAKPVNTKLELIAFMTGSEFITEHAIHCCFIPIKVYMLCCQSSRKQIMSKQMMKTKKSMDVKKTNLIQPFRQNHIILYNIKIVPLILM